MAKLDKLTAADRRLAEQNAQLAVDIGRIRPDEKDSYIKGWLNRGFLRKRKTYERS